MKQFFKKLRIKKVRAPLLLAVLSILIAPASITFATIFNLSQTKSLILISIGVGLSIICFIIALTQIILILFQKLDSANKVVTSQLFTEVKFQEFVDCAKKFGRKPITKKQYDTLSEAHNILSNRQHMPGKDIRYNNEELKLLTVAGKILFDHLEVEFLISPNDPLKLEKINESLLVGTLEKIQEEINDESTQKNIATRISDITGQEVEEILYDAPKDKKKLH